MKTTIKIDYPATKKGRSDWAKKYGLNAYYSGKPWQVRKKDADYWHMLTRCAVHEAAKTQGIPLFDKPVYIRFFWNDGLDLDNHAVMRKMIIDGLKGRLIIDDTRKHIAGLQDCWHSENYILVEVEEMATD